MKAKISVCDHNGDSVLAEYDTENAQSVDVAQDKLTAFLTDCVARYGNEPPVWGRRIGKTEFSSIGNNGINLFEELVVHQPLVGG